MLFFFVQFQNLLQMQYRDCLLCLTRRCPRYFHIRVFAQGGQNDTFRSLERLGILRAVFTDW